MNLQKKLTELKRFIGTDNKEFENRLKEIKTNHTSASELKIIDDFIRSGLNELTTDLNNFNRDISLKIKLNEIKDVVSVSYISRYYFKKSRQWFYQRLNGYIVNGKPAKFTPEELKTLDFALQDISKKIGSVRVS